MRFAYILAGLMTLDASVALADNWRDGCPVGRVPGYQQTKAHWLGTASSTDSGLLPSRVSKTTGFAYLTSRGSTERTRLYHGRLVLAVADRRFTASVALPTMYRFAPEGGHGDGALGNATLSFGVRRLWITQLDGETARDLSDPTDKQRPPSVIGNLRGGWSVQATASARAWSNENLQDLSTDTARLSFYRHDFARETIASPLTAMGVRAEYRLEMVGCYAPFVHVAAAPLVEGDENAAADELHLAVSVPLTITAGLEVATRTSVYFEYGLSMRGGRRADRDPELSPVWKFTTNHRLRLGFELAAGSWFRFGGALDYYTGTLDGLFAGLTFTAHKAYK